MSSVAQDKICSMPGCGEKHKAHGYCSKHYQRMKNNGDPAIASTKPPRRKWPNRVKVAYFNMMARCYYKRHPNYHRYGGRGIHVCDAWLGDEGKLRFLRDMGEPPRGYSLERINNDKDYSKNNCKWILKGLQSRNQERTILYEIHGERKCLADWCDIMGACSRNIAQNRISNGWDPFLAITTPKMATWRRRCHAEAMCHKRASTSLKVIRPLQDKNW